MSAYDTLVLAESALVHYWPMSEAGGSGTIADSKGALSGTVQSGVTLGSTAIFGPEGTSAAFDGTSNAYISFADKWGNDANWTYEELVYSLSNGKTAWTNGAFGLAGALKLVVKPDDDQLDLSSWIAPDLFVTAANDNSVPYHAVETFDGTTKRFYLNGVELANSVAAVDTPAGSVAYIGCGAQFGGTRNEFWNGRLSKMAYYNAALSPSALLAHYTSLLPGGVLRPRNMSGIDGRYLSDPLGA